MKTQIYLSFIIASVMTYSLTVSAVTISQPWQRSTTEAGSCEGGRCLAGTQQKSNILQFCESLRDRAAWAQDWTCQNTAIFDDGNDRDILYDLRRKNPNTLTDEERAILVAADRYGNVGFCSNSGGNATVIIHNGRPAIITSAHMFYDQSGNPKCSDRDLRNASFAPNVSYYDSEGNEHPRSFTHRSVGLEMPPVSMNRRRTAQGFHAQDDFVIVYLKEDITKDVMPNGNVRGAMSMATQAPRRGENLHMIGVAPDVRQGLAVVNQTCQFRTATNIGVQHTCDTVRGSSGSMMAVMEDGELRLRGIHTSAIRGNEVLPPANPSVTIDWNLATDFVNNPNL